MHPPHLPDLLEQIKPYRAPLQTGAEAFASVDWPEHLKDFAQAAQRSASLAMQSFNDFLSAPNQSNATMAAYRAMGYATKSLEAVYPLAHMLPPVSRFFLNPERREDADLLARIDTADGSREDVGVMHAANSSDERGGFSLYVPEYYAGEQVPLVVALHGGSGHGRSFLWSWLRTARSENVIVVSPTSNDNTWSLMGPDVDADQLQRLVAYVQSHWNIDPERICLTGMSDGGTYSYVCGLQNNTPFTHLAPSSASFHPMLVEVAEAQRIQDLPIYLMHGALDWMFPVDMARTAAETLSAAGAQVVYREIDDLSHTYPVEENPRIVAWLRQ